MSLTNQDLVTRIGIVQEFNSKIWNAIMSAVGNRVYHAGGQITTGDKLETASGTTNIVLYAIPRFSGTSRYGAQDTSGTGVVKESNPVAIPAAHLQNIPAGQRVRLTLHKDDLVINSDGDVTADTVYNACFSVLQALLRIRPFKARWVHESSFSDKRIDKQYSSGFTYALFKDYPVNYNSKISTSKPGGWGEGYSLSYWAINRGSNIAALTTSQVQRSGVVKDMDQSADSMNNLISNIWNVWVAKCQNQNNFDYTYYSCHLNCHSSCHSSCHGSRSRR